MTAGLSTDGTDTNMNESAEHVHRNVNLLNDQLFLNELRQQMLSFATLQLGDSHWAEDAVQEALVGAFRNIRSFSGQSALKTWVFAILKNKIADILRQKRRLIDASSLLRETEEDEDFMSLFDSKGMWHQEERPIKWEDPEASFENAQFWKIFETCLENLPPRQARLFMMREFVELETDEICEATGITANYLFVMLHRARLRIRECLENRWFSMGRI